MSKHVLIVEENEDYRWLISYILSRAGFTIHSLDHHQFNGESTSYPEIDLIIASVENPHDSGTVSLKKIRAFLPEIPVLLLSCGDMSLNQARLLGASKILRKPVDSTLFTETVFSFFKEAETSPIRKFN